MYTDLSKVQYHKFVMLSMVCNNLLLLTLSGEAKPLHQISTNSIDVCLQGAVSQRCSESSIPSTSSARSVWSSWTKARSRSRTTSPTVTAALRSSLVDHLLTTLSPNLRGLRMSERLSTESYIKLSCVGNRWLYNAKLIEIGLP